MTFLPRSTWRYAILIIVLFAIAAVAATQTISSLEHEFSLLGRGADSEIVQTVSLAIWLLTFGFMFLAGALGLWGIRTSVEIESRRRIARLVDAMDYLTDGMVMLESDGTLSGCNPAAQAFALKPIARQRHIREAFPVLTDADCFRLLDAGEAREIERDAEYPSGRRTLRFRSQHSAGVNLVIISDVTDVKSEEIRRKQVAQLQLVGRIAAGVAHDFNNILCAVSGHASLIDRIRNDPEAMRQSLDFILAEADRGTQLSRQLLELSRSSASEPASSALDDNVEEAAGLLRVALSPAWTVSTTIEGKFPAVPLAPAQVEQVVLNLGLLAADAQPRPGTVTITLGRPGEGHLTDVGGRFAAVVIISAESRPPIPAPAHPVIPAPDDRAKPAADESGVIPSVVRSLVEEVGGCLDHLGGPDGLCIYRVCLPHLDVAAHEPDMGGLEEVLRVRLHDARVLLALPKPVGDLVERMIRPAGARVSRQEDALAVLADLEGTPDLDLIVLHESVLGGKPSSLLKAMSRLAPAAAFLVLGLPSDAALAEAGIPVAVAADSPAPAALARAMLEAAGLAAGRRARSPDGRAPAGAGSRGGSAASALRSG